MHVFVFVSVYVLLLTMSHCCLSLSPCLSDQVLLNANANVNQTTSDGALEKEKKEMRTRSERREERMNDLPPNTHIHP